MLRHFKELYQYRGLLLSLTTRELKARYRGSVLGFLWTFLNPTLLMLVYALVFSVYMRAAIENYTYFMFVGLLPWIAFSSSVMSGASSISDRRDLMTKVRFPAQVLPATVVTVNLLNYLFSLPLMIGLGIAFREYLTVHALFFPFVLAVQIVFTLAVVYVLSALNVAFRDLQHIIQNLVTLWFFLTPVLYSAKNIPEGARQIVLYGNPMSIIVVSYQAMFYDHRMPDLTALFGLLLVSLALLYIATQVFERRREEFAETV
jgi:lipopolysaccharide transport system permease protein